MADVRGTGDRCTGYWWQMYGVLVADVRDTGGLDWFIRNFLNKSNMIKKFKTTRQYVRLCTDKL